MTDDRIITANGICMCAVAAFLVALVLWAGVSAVFPDEPNGYYGTQDALKFTNETRVREWADEKTWGEGKRIRDVYKEGGGK